MFYLMGFCLCVCADCLPVQFDACLLLQLSPQLVALLHHVGVEVLIVGLADDAGLAMGAPSGVGQDELERINIKTNNFHLGKTPIICNRITMEIINQFFSPCVCTQNSNGWIFTKTSILLQMIHFWC